MNESMMVCLPEACVRNAPGLQPNITGSDCDGPPSLWLGKAVQR